MRIPTAKGSGFTERQYQEPRKQDERAPVLGEHLDRDWGYEQPVMGTPAYRWRDETHYAPTLAEAEALAVAAGNEALAHVLAVVSSRDARLARRAERIAHSHAHPGKLVSAPTE